jgi:hypothetical protein
VVVSLDSFSFAGNERMNLLEGPKSWESFNLDNLAIKSPGSGVHPAKGGMEITGFQLLSE